MKFGYHHISLMLFPLRCGGYGIMSVCALMLYAHGYISGWVGLYAIATVLIWGPVVLYISGHLPYPRGKNFDLAMLNYVDPIITGVWLILVKGSPWYLLFAALGLGTGMCSVLGFATWLRALTTIILLGFVGVWWNDFHVLLNTPLELKVFALTACMVYPLIIGRNQHYITTRIEETKTQLEASVTELNQMNQLMQAMIASKTMLALMKNLNRYMHDFFGFKSVDLWLLDDHQDALCLFNLSEHQEKADLQWPLRLKNDDESLLLTAFSTGKSAVLNQVSKYDGNYPADKPYFNKNKHDHVFIMPLKYIDKVLGCLCLFSDNNIDESEGFSNKLSNYLSGVAIIVSNHQTLKSFTISQVELKEKNENLKNESGQLSKYLSPQIYEWIFSSKSKININASRKRITFMIVSMQNFYQVLDQLDSDKIIQFVNSYLTCMSKLILQHGGTIDQYVGVQIRIFFGDPTSLGVKKDALNSLQLALSMQQAFQQFKQAWPSDLVAQLGLRTAISSGYTDVGNFGSEYRMNYTVMGNIVKVVTHLLSQAQTEQILITEDTRLLTKAYAQVTPLEPLHLNPKAKAIAIYQLNALLPTTTTVVG